MVLVDTTVWIDFFGDRPGPHVVALQELIENDEDLCLCGVILAEVLQGVRSDSDYRKTKDYLDVLILLPMRRTTFIQAAEIYRSLRKKGVTIRKPMSPTLPAQNRRPKIAGPLHQTGIRQFVDQSSVGRSEPRF